MITIEAIVELKAKLHRLPSEIPVMLQEIFSELAAETEDANISQLQRGQRADGRILPDYSPVSVRVFGKPPGPIRLFDTGAFYQGITLKVFVDGIELTGVDIKTEMLQAIYGDEIIGLTEESLAALIQDYVEPMLQERITKFLLE